VRLNNAAPPDVVIQKQCTLRACLQLNTEGVRSAAVDRHATVPRTRLTTSKYGGVIEFVTDSAKFIIRKGSFPREPVATFAMSVVQRVDVALSLMQAPSVNYSDRRYLLKYETLITRLEQLAIIARADDPQEVDKLLAG